MTDPAGLRWLPGPRPGARRRRTSRTQHLGRPCLRFGDVNLTPTLPGVVLSDGVVEVDLAVTAERAFHGLIWRVQDAQGFESFFVRPHQVGNPDSIQYTPVNNGISSWQLFHGPASGPPVAFPIGGWFTIRVEFAAPAPRRTSAISPSPCCGWRSSSGRPAAAGSACWSAGPASTSPASRTLRAAGPGRGDIAASRGPSRDPGMASLRSVPEAVVSRLTGCPPTS